MRMAEPSALGTDADGLPQRRSEYTSYADSSALIKALTIACKNDDLDIAYSCLMDEDETLGVKGQIMLLKQGIEISTGWRFV
jgi:hypothetical protein